MATSPKMDQEVFSGSAKPKRFRLSPALVNDISQIACGSDESDAGIRTRYLIDLAAGAGCRDLGDVQMFDAERWLDSRYEFDRLEERVVPTQMHSRRTRALRAIRKLLASPSGHQHVGVLFTSYGSRDGNSGCAPARHRLRQEQWRLDRLKKKDRELGIDLIEAARRQTSERVVETALEQDMLRADAVGARERAGLQRLVPSPKDRPGLNVTEELCRRLGDELAPLARYTDAVERHRQTMIELQIASVMDATPPVDTRWLNGRNQASFDASCHWGLGVCGDLHRLAVNHRAKADLELLNRERLRSARIHAERNIASMDAIVDAMRGTHGRLADESSDTYRLRVQTRDAERAVFMTDVMVDASDMLTDASLAFKDAWARS